MNTGLMSGDFVNLTRSLVAIVLAILVGSISLAEEYTVGEDSTITYHVYHPMHDVSATGQDITVLKNPDYNPEKPLDFSGVVNIPIQANWKSFDSGNNNRDANTRLVVKASQFPQITYVVESVTNPTQLSGGKIKATTNGRMYVAGQKQPTTATIELDTSDSKNLQVSVKTQINMTDFGIDPPKLLLIAADEFVDIEAKLNLIPSK